MAPRRAQHLAALLLHQTHDFLKWQRSSSIRAILAHFAWFGVVIHRLGKNVDKLFAMLCDAQGLPHHARDQAGRVERELILRRCVTVTATANLTSSGYRWRLNQLSTSMISGPLMGRSTR
jgi:hypothetical protein